MDITKSLTGISGILVTPFDSAGDIAPDLQKPIVERAIAAGVHILTANGNTGEFYSLTTDEAVAMVDAAARHIDGFNARRHCMLDGFVIALANLPIVFHDFTKRRQ